MRVRQRLSLGGKGPRALAVCGSGLLVANYFSDDLCLVDLEGGEPPGRAIPLGPAIEPTLVRRGEMLFNDGTLCRGNWQSCASCHDSDGRVDGLNWDLLNDGAKNPKNTKSLLWAHQTPPAMALGVRTNAETAVRAGLQHILFSDPGKDVPEAIDAYLKSLRPMTSPWLVEGRLSAAAERGKALFNSAEVGCARCHPEPWFTDRGQYDVATVGRRDRPTDRFDTPSLVELWRTAPYLHDGRAARLEQVLGKFNARDKHGNTSHLTCWQIADLVEYLLSL